jgi:hypothetical protein
MKTREEILKLATNDKEREVLLGLEWAVRCNQGPQMDGWVRPMDVGGSNCSHHSATLKRLLKRGLVERKRRCVSIVAALGSNRAGYAYRLLP